jgi:hypothetical protein
VGTKSSFISENYKIKLHAGAAICPDSQFINIWRCLAVVHDNSVNLHSIHPYDFQRILSLLVWVILRM